MSFLLELLLSAAIDNDGDHNSTNELLLSAAIDNDGDHNSTNELLLNSYSAFLLKVKS